MSTMSAWPEYLSILVAGMYCIETLFLPWGYRRRGERGGRELKKGERLLLNGLYVSNDDKTENAA